MGAEEFFDDTAGPQLVDAADANASVCLGMACCNELDGVECEDEEEPPPLSKKTKFMAAMRTLHRWIRYSGSRREAFADAVKEDDKSDIIAYRDGHVKLVGNEVDRQIFRASNYQFEDLSASQPLIVDSTTNATYRVLRRFEFDRSRMTMSVVVEDIETHKRFVYTKGSYESLKVYADPATVPHDYDRRTNWLATAGYYVLGLGCKEYDGPDDIGDGVVRSELESGLQLIGLLVFENKLKPDTTQVIDELKEGNTRPVIVTGDNAKTGVKVARECHITTAQTIVLGDLCDGHVVWTDIKTDAPSPSPADMITRLMVGEVELAVTGGAFNRLCEPILAEDVSSQSSSQKDSSVKKVVNAEASSVMEEEEAKSEISAEDESEMTALLPYTRIFARMKPDQKVEAVKLLMTTGVTAMCGDGANDAGALRVAHVGLAISSGGGATMVAPFSSPHDSLQSVITIVREGRAALANALAAYKNLMMYGEIMVLVAGVQFYFGVVLSEATWIYVDAVVNLGMAWAVMQSRSAKRLAPNRPTSKLIGYEVFISVFLQIIWNGITIIATICILYRQSFYVCKEFDPNLADPARWWLKGDNYEGVVYANVFLFLFTNSAAVYNIGFDFRRKWISNLWVVCCWLFGMGFSIYLIFGQAEYFTCLFRFNCGDESLLTRWDELGMINYKGGVSTVPPGCPCSQEVAYSYTCENEYSFCDADMFSQTYHHNLVPLYFRFVIFGIAATNVIMAFVIEYVIILGPVRKYFRKRKAAKRAAEKEAAIGAITELSIAAAERKSSIVSSKQIVSKTSSVSPKQVESNRNIK
eukprot:CAMPEP_0113844336 /NCGR_PEP_ID=MMETSP0372-20130328/187_1 /TAXON_ID=340204 /ORGANISM="Lankesteria abbotti" /LENGTH=810 /DNA_ID=CAMNT_0000813341 /DNA_START=294 /DNA_END=2727 /DNA_ORIENTATION=+ /assembly_acc=CAM_ASM_000359